MDNLNEKQKHMEERIKYVMARLSGKDAPDRIEKIMNPHFISCNYEEKSLTIAYDVVEWELNPQGVFHGGLTTTAFDNAFGLLTHFFADETYVTTVEISTHFHKAIQLGDRMVVSVKATHIGKTLAGYTGELRIANRDNLLAATASTTFMMLHGKKSELLDTQNQNNN